MGESSGQQQTTTTQQLTPEQQQLMQAATGNYMNFNASNPTLPTGDQAVAPFNPNQVAGQQQTLGASGQMEPVVGTAAGTNQYLSSGAFLDPGSNPYVKNAMTAADQPILDTLNRSTLPGVSSAAASGSGANFGGSRQGVLEANAMNDANRQIGATNANIANTALGQGLTATNTAIGQAPTTAASLAIPGATTSAVGDVQQQQQQNVLNANNAAQWFQNMLPLLKGQSLMQAAGAAPGGSATSTGNVTQQANPVSQTIGLIAALGGLAGGLGGRGGLLGA
jgi:hypothetical protein